MEDKRSPYGKARSWHLATNADDSLATKFEFALMQIFEAYQRSVVQVQRVVGDPNLGYNEGVLLHIVRMQGRAKDAATIARLVNRDDLPNVLYSLRKLVSLDLIRKVRSGTTTLFEVTEKGIAETDRYAELRRELIVSRMCQITDLAAKMPQATELLESLTGCYDSAAREAATMDPSRLFSDEAALSGGAEPPADADSSR